MSKELIESLEFEKLGYERRGLKDRAAEVQKEIDKLKPKKTAKKASEGK